MKNILLLPLLVLALFLFTGCPYESSYPLGDMGKEPVNTTWDGPFKAAQDDDNFSYVNISFNLNNPVKYIIKGPSATGDATENYEGFYTTLAGREFLYVKLNNSKAGKFYIFGIDSIGSDGSTFRCREVAPEAFTGMTITSTDELRKAVEAKLKENKLFGKEHIFKFDM